MENLETLVTIITNQNKTIEALRKELESQKESVIFWYNKFNKLEESLIEKTEE